MRDSAILVGIFAALIYGCPAAPKPQVEPYPVLAVTAVADPAAPPALPPRKAPRQHHAPSKGKLSEEYQTCIDEHVGTLDEDEAADVCEGVGE